MSAEFKVVDKNLVITVPLKTITCNPYDDRKFIIDNIIGVIDGNDYGFAYVIDMSYKGKSDQYTEIFYIWSGSQEDFEIFCHNNHIGIIY